MGHDVTLRVFQVMGPSPLECAAKFNIHAWIFWFVLIERGWADSSCCHEMSALSRCLETMLKRDYTDKNKPDDICLKLRIDLL